MIGNVQTSVLAVMLKLAGPCCHTLDYLRDHVWWKDLVSDTKAFCETCATCKRSKPSNQKPYGLLNPLPVPSQPWESIGIDFVGPLPESKNRDGIFDSITVVICLLTAMVHLIPSRINYNARQIAELMFEEIYKLHGLPKNIISDRDVLFTSVFWGHLHKLIGTKLKMSSAYHPETDGSTERANRTVTQMLRQCINNKQTDWVSKLPAIEFAINSARSESTGFAPFFLNTGRMPRSLIWTSAKSNEYPTIRAFAMQRKLALISAHDSILAARVKQTRNANQKHQLAPFKENDLVYISTKNISFPKGLARKLVPKYIGPYKIIKDYKNQSFQIDLPSDLKQRGVHNVFHASLLRIHIPNDDRLFPGRLDTQLSLGDSSEGEWAVDKILSHTGAKDSSIFEVLWQAGDITWLPYHQISHLNALPVYLDLLGVSDILELPKGHGKPPADDPQVFSGQLEITPAPQHHKSLSQHPNQLRHSTPLIPCSFSKVYAPCRSLSLSAIMPDTDIILPDAPPIVTSSQGDPAPTITSEKKLPKFNPRSIEHAHIKRLSRTKFLATDPLKDQKYYFHAGQIADFCTTDAILRQRKVPLAFPASYNDFAEVFNTHIEDNPIRFTTYDSKTKEFDLNGDPITLNDFFITEEDIGTKPRRSVSVRTSEPKPRGKKRSAPEPMEPVPSSSNSSFSPLVVEPEPEPLTPKRAKVVENLLWHAAETLHRQQQRFESAKATRLQKKNDATLLAAARARSSTS